MDLRIEPGLLQRWPKKCINRSDWQEPFDPVRFLETFRCEEQAAFLTR